MLIIREIMLGTWVLTKHPLPFSDFGWVTSTLSTIISRSQTIFWKSPKLECILCDSIYIQCKIRVMVTEIRTVLFYRWLRMTGKVYEGTFCSLSWPRYRLHTCTQFSDWIIKSWVYTNKFLKSTKIKEPIKYITILKSLKSIIYIYHLSSWLCLSIYKY